MTATEEQAHQLEPSRLTTSGKGLGGDGGQLPGFPPKGPDASSLSPKSQGPRGVLPWVPKPPLLFVTVNPRGLSEGLPFFERGWLTVSVRTKALLNKSEKCSAQSKTL